MTDAKRMNLASIDFRQRLPSRKEYFWQKLEKGVYRGYRANNATWHRGHGRENGLGKTGPEVVLGKAIQLSFRTRGPRCQESSPPNLSGGLRDRGATGTSCPGEPSRVLSAGAQVISVREVSGNGARTDG